MHILITYEVTKGEEEVKEAMKKMNYFDEWESDNISYPLPPSTLWRKERQVKEGLQDIQGAIRTLNATTFENNKITLEKCVVVPCNPWAAISYPITP